MIKIKDETLKNNLLEMINKIPTMSDETLQYDLEWYSELMNQTNKDTELYQGYNLYINEIKKYLNGNTRVNDVKEEVKENKNPKVDLATDMEKHKEIDEVEADTVDDEVEEIEIIKIINDKGEKNYIELKRKVVKLPMPTENEILKDRKVDLKTYSLMVLYSNCQTKEQREEVEEMYRFLYYNKIIDNSEEMEELSKWKLDTIKRNIKKLAKLENRLVMADRTKDGKIVYYINYSDNNGRKFIPVEEPILKILTACTNSNVIKVYLFLRYYCDYKQKTTKDNKWMITREYICEKVGMKNVCTITNMTDFLADMDLINKFNTHENIDGTVIDHNYYNIVSYEEYKARKRAKKEARKIKVPKDKLLKDIAEMKEMQKLYEEGKDFDEI